MYTSVFYFNCNVTCTTRENKEFISCATPATFSFVVFIDRKNREQIKTYIWLEGLFNLLISTLFCQEMLYEYIRKRMLDKSSLYTATPLHVVTEHLHRKQKNV